MRDRKGLIVDISRETKSCPMMKASGELPVNDGGVVRRVLIEESYRSTGQLY
jgi:hypothetical protein